MGFLEEVEVLKKEKKIELDKIEIEKEKTAKKIKNEIRNTIKERYLETTKADSKDDSCYYLNKAITDIKNKFLNDCHYYYYTSIEGIFLELYEELKNEIYIEIGYEAYSLKEAKWELDDVLVGEMSFGHLDADYTGIYLRINSIKSKYDSSNHIETDKKSANIECKKIKNQIAEIRKKEKFNNTIFGKMLRLLKINKKL